MQLMDGRKEIVEVQRLDTELGTPPSPQLHDNMDEGGRDHVLEFQRQSYALMEYRQDMGTVGHIIIDNPSL
jgi:hypothetical protein